MRIIQPYPNELMQIARKVVWYDTPERTLCDLNTFLAHLMVYGSPSDMVVIEQYVPEEDFQKALEAAPSGVFTQEAWERWHECLGMLPAPPLPRRRFPDGSYGPEPAAFFGR